MDGTERTMIVMNAGDSRFQLRACALIRSNGHILIHRVVGDPCWVLPGGRVEFHEAGAETLAREMEEEIGSQASIGPLRFVIENFFELAGRRVHEVGFYYEVELLRPLPFDEANIVHRVQDGSADVEFRWALPTRAVLDQFGLLPMPLRGLVEMIPDGIHHLVRRDTAAE